MKEERVINSKKVSKYILYFINFLKLFLEKIYILFDVFLNLYR